MTFPGLKDDRARADLIAHLKLATAEGAASPGGEQAQMPGGEMMRGRAPLDLQHDVKANNRITAIRYCRDIYTVDVASGHSHPFWEFNLRFKTDSSNNGPEPGQPVLIPAGIVGDRAFVVFASPGEISASIDSAC